MALIITATENAKLPLKGTEIELASIYARINWNAPMSGKSIQYSLIPFISKAFYQNDNPVMVTFEGGAGYIQLVDGDSQSLQFVHDKIKEKLEAIGYIVTIELT